MIQEVLAAIRDWANPKFAEIGKSTDPDTEPTVHGKLSALSTKCAEIDGKVGTPLDGQPANMFAAIAASGGKSAQTIPLIEMVETTAALDPQKVYVWGEVDSLNITLNAPTQGIAPLYTMQFRSGNTATNVVFPSNISTHGDVLSNRIVTISILGNEAYIS